MATTKVMTEIWSATTLTAAAGDTTSAAITLDDGYGAFVSIKLTNGATGPTVAAQVQIQTSQDGTVYFNYGGPLVGSLVNAAVTSWSVEIPIGVEYLKLVAGSNTGQNVTVDADISEVTAVA